MSTTTSRLALTQPVGSDPPATLRTAITANSTILDKAVLCTPDTLVNRPLANAVPADSIFRSTDTGVYYITNGTIWLTMIVAGVWTALTFASGVGAGSAAGTPYTPSARLEGDVVRLKGALKNTTAGNKAKDTLFATVPASCIPTATAQLLTPASVNFDGPYAYVDTSGNLKCGTQIAASGIIPLDGVTYTLS